MGWTARTLTGPTPLPLPCENSSDLYQFQERPVAKVVVCYVLYDSILPLMNSCFILNVLHVCTHADKVIIFE